MVEVHIEVVRYSHRPWPAKIRVVAPPAWKYQGLRTDWPTQNAWTFDYQDTDQRPHTVTVTDVRDTETTLLVDGEVTPKDHLKYTVISSRGQH
jgi:hypothetical protein